MRAKFDLLRRYGGSVVKLAEAVRDDPQVRAEAERELAAVAPFGQRCVMSRDYAQALRRALNGLE